LAVLSKKFRFILTVVLALIAVIYIIDNSNIILKINYPLKFEEYVIKYSNEYKLDPYLVWALIKAESGFNPEAISSKNARGLMQISENTAIEGAQKLKMDKFKVEDLFDPEVNIRLGCWYFRWLLDQFNNNVDLAIAAYNGGIGNVTNWLKDKSLSSNGHTLDKIPFEETDKFHKRVKDNYAVYRNIYAGE